MSFQIKTEKRLSAENVKRIIAMGLSLKNSIESIEQGLIEEYDSSKTYAPNMACYYNDYLYRCLFTTTGEFDINSWEKVGDSLELVNKAQVEAMLGLTPDELDTLANLILDSEVRLDKTWSSSKIYESVQEAIRQNKKFTLEEFAKANKASYTVADSVDTMTDQSTIYLLKNDTTYDMYIVQVDGTPTKIGDVNIDLTQYVKTTELNSHIEDKSVHFENQAEKDSMLTRDDIVTTIDDTATNDQVPSAKAVYESTIRHIANYTDDDADGLDFNNLIEDGIYTFGIGSPIANSPVGRTLTYGNLRVIRYKNKGGYFISQEYTLIELGVATLYVRSYAQQTDTWREWHKVSATTTVVDIPKTIYNLDTSCEEVYEKCDTSTDNNWYLVKNGICFVQIDLVCKKKGAGYRRIFSSFPKPVAPVAFSIAPTENATIDTNFPILIAINAEGIMSAYGGSIAPRYIKTFSYPVAE